MICTEISAADVPLAKNYQLMFGLHRIMSLSWFAQNYPQMYSLACVMFSQQRTASCYVRVYILLRTASAAF